MGGSLGPSLSLFLEGPKVWLGRVSLCIFVCFLLYLCSVSVVSWKKILNKKSS